MIVVGLVEKREKSATTFVLEPEASRGRAGQPSSQPVMWRRDLANKTQAGGHLQIGSLSPLLSFFTAPVS
jgi:hypothetical protein